MTRLSLDGENLGKKHYNYNKLLKDIVANKKDSQLLPINYDDSDIDNFLKIDLASYNKNVDYILEVFKCEDMLYATRAIKKSLWLITDDQYAHIINPKYLNSTLFQSMTNKAFNKLMFEIRTNLVDTKRCEEFYNYYKDDNFEIAGKWLPRCSTTFIEQEIKAKGNDMSLVMLQNLCKVSISILEVCVKHVNSYKRCLMEENTHYMKEDLSRFLDIAESTKESYEFPTFGPKQTKLLMRAQDRVIKNFVRYWNDIDMETFAKEMDPKKIKDFLKGLTSEKKLKSLFKFDSIKHFIHNMPKEDRFGFVKEMFIDKAVNVEDTENDAVPYARCGIAMKCSAVMESDEWNSSNFSNIYRWYIFSPFDVAFPELTKLIRAESSFSERNAMFLILIGCAKHNLQHVKTLLSYYHKKHINEPAKYKISFVDNVISKTNVYTYDEETWKLLNDIFYSLEVYNVNRNEPEVNLNSCIKSIILYNTLHNLAVPETVENKFSFETFKDDQKKLKSEDKAKIFDYLFTYIQSKTQNVSITSETIFGETFNNLKHMFNLINDWKKNLSDYPFALEKVKELIKIKKENSWDIDLSSLYNLNKSWRKYMFEESLEMYPTEDACLNALKHDPELLSRNKDKIEKIRQKDNIPLDKVLKKIRTYWSQSLAEQWQSEYQAKLKESNETGHKGLVKGLCILLPQKQLLDIVKEHAPNEKKVNWGEEDELELTLRKLIAKNMYLSRPLVPPESIMLYAKGDYLQYALPSFNAVFDNLCPAKTREHIPELLRAPVSLQKHGIRLVYLKQKSKELYSTLSELWKTNQNKTIRATIFTQVFKLLCAEKDKDMQDHIWNIINGFIDDLTPDENKIIYTTLGKVSDVPRPVRAKYCMKSYKFLKSLPTKANCDKIIRDVVDSTIYIMEDLDLEFISNIVMEDFDKKICKSSYEHTSIVSSCLLGCKTKEEQSKRYEDVVVPLIERIFDLWDEKDKQTYTVRKNFDSILNEIISDYIRFVCARKMSNPVSIFENILSRMESKLDIEENYLMLRKWKLMTAFAKSVDTQVDKFAEFDISESETESRWYSDNGKFNKIFFESNKEFAKDVFECLKEDTEKLFPSIGYLFEEAYSNLMDNIRVDYTVRVDVERQVLNIIPIDFIPGHLFVLSTITTYIGSGESESEKITIEICKKLMNHPSREVKLHYYQKYQFKPEPSPDY